MLNRGSSRRQFPPTKKPLIAQRPLQNQPQSPIFWSACELWDAASSHILRCMPKYVGLDRMFHALGDSSRRAMVERLSRGPASVSELARPLGMSMPGLLKHVRILEQAQLVTTQKQGRVRECRLDPGQLDDAARWIQARQQRWERRLDRLGSYLERQGTAP